MTGATKLDDRRGTMSARDAARAVFDHAQIGMAVLDSTGVLMQTNPALQQLLGLESDTLSGRSLASLVDADDKPTCATALAALAADGTARVIDLRRPTSDDSERWIRVHLSRTLDDNAAASPIVGTFEDVTAQRKTADDARATTRRMQQLVERANDIIFNIDLEGRFTWSSPSASRLMKRPLDELIGMSFLELVHPDYRDDAGRFYQHQVTHRIPSTYYEFPTVSGDGDEIWLGQNVQLIIEDDEIVNIQAVARDITARKHAEAALRESEDRLREVAKMEAIGRLAGGVAHDFNNQLTAILGFAEMLEKSFDDDDPRADDVRQIIRGGRQAAALTQQLLAFGRKQPRRPAVLDLNAVLTNLEPLLRHTIREGGHLDAQLVPNLWPVTADEVQIEQVIMNLALNSRDAMPAGGHLTIRTANVTLDESRVRHHPPLAPGPYVMVAVTDTGDGIDAQTRAHLFEPFFTTKEEGKGTGMGLASAYGIIKQSGGFIEVASELGCGSTFTFYLPSTDTPASLDDKDHASDPAPGTTRPQPSRDA